MWKRYFKDTWAIISKSKPPQLYCGRFGPRSDKKVVSEFTIRNNGPDVMVANAGISVGAKDGSLNFPLGRKVIEINVLGLMNTFEAAVENFKNGGHLVMSRLLLLFLDFPVLRRIQLQRLQCLDIAKP